LKALAIAHGDFQDLLVGKIFFSKGLRSESFFFDIFQRILAILHYKAKLAINASGNTCNAKTHNIWVLELFQNARFLRQSLASSRSL